MTGSPRDRISLFFPVYRDERTVERVATKARRVFPHPQEGFLHQKFLTDTMGFDEPETKCRFNK